MRLDGLDSLGESSQTLCELYIETQDWDVAADLAEYFLDEMTRINDALYTWLGVILGWPETDPAARPDAAAVVAAMSSFEPGDGDLTAVLDACRRQDAGTAAARLELMRVRVAAVHDQLVWWIHHLLADAAAERGDDAVREIVELTYERLWRVRYQAWGAMTPLERLQLSVEGMRGHLSGPRHRGEVGLSDEPDRYTMTLDPCGSCGVLRRGDPDSGRPGCEPRGTTRAHPWSWNRVGVGWYAVHSPIVMEWLHMRDGRPPLRPLQGCDTTGPCRWFIYKDPRNAREEHYTDMGFDPPQGNPDSRFPV